MQVGAHSGNAVQLDLLARLLDGAQQRGMPVWLGGGWAIDARLGRITREHGDLDLTFPAEQHEAFLELLASLGATVTEVTGYGFLADCAGVLLDCEPAQWNGSAYEVEGTPPGSCPDAPEGVLAGRRVRCNSWAAILWDYFHYADELPRARWAPRHRQSWELATSAVGAAGLARLQAQFATARTCPGAPRD